MFFRVFFTSVTMRPPMLYRYRRQLDAVWLILVGLTGASQQVYGCLRCFPSGKRFLIAVGRPEDCRGNR